MRTLNISATRGPRDRDGHHRAPPQGNGASPRELLEHQPHRGRSRMNLKSQQDDRVAGYEFGDPLSDGASVTTKDGGPFRKPELSATDILNSPAVSAPTRMAVIPSGLKNDGTFHLVDLRKHYHKVEQ